MLLRFRMERIALSECLGEKVLHPIIYN